MKSFGVLLLSLVYIGQNSCLCLNSEVCIQCHHDWRLCSVLIFNSLVKEGSLKHREQNNKERLFFYSSRK